MVANFRPLTFGRSPSEPRSSFAGHKCASRERSYLGTGQPLRLRLVDEQASPLGRETQRVLGARVGSVSRSPVDFPALGRRFATAILQRPLRSSYSTLLIHRFERVRHRSRGPVPRPPMLLRLLPINPGSTSRNQSA